jgi:hypothetical protein
MAADGVGRLHIFDTNDIESAPQIEDEPFLEFLPRGTSKKFPFILESLQTSNSTGPVFDHEWFENSKKFICAVSDPSVQIYDTETCKLIFTGKDHLRTVRCVTGCPTNKSNFFTENSH